MSGSGFIVAMVWVGVFSCHTGLHLSGGKLEVSLNIESSVERISVYEGLPVMIRFTNRGELPMQINEEMFSTHGFGGITVVGPEGTRRDVDKPILNLRQIRREKVPTIALPAGGTHEFKVMLTCDWGLDEPVFSAPGSYRISAYYEEGDERVESNFTAIEVLPPSPTEARAIRLIVEYEFRQVLYEPEMTIASTRESDHVGFLESVSGCNESVILANYASLALAKRAITLGEIWRREQGKMKGHLASADKWLSRITREPPAIKREIDEVRRKLEEYKVNPLRP